MKNKTHTVKSAPCTCTSSVNGRPPKVAVGPPVNNLNPDTAAFERLAWQCCGGGCCHRLLTLNEMFRHQLSMKLEFNSSPCYFTDKRCMSSSNQLKATSIWHREDLEVNPSLRRVSFACLNFTMYFFHRDFGIP